MTSVADLAPIGAELDAALAFTPDGYSDADGQDHVTVTAQKALNAADAGVPLAGSKREGRQDQIHRDEMEALTVISLTARSAALRRLVRKGMKLKLEAEALWEPHRIADERVRDLRVAGAPADDIAAADLDDRATWSVWEAKRRETEVAAEEVANAPFSDLSDVLVRARAAALLIGVNGDDECIPENDDDALVILRSYRSAIEEMIARVPDREEWDETVIALREVDRSLSTANQEWEDAGGSRMDFQESDHPALRTKLDLLYADRTRLRTKLLSASPPDVEGLLHLMEVVFDHGALIDVGTYERRAFILGGRPISEDEMWGGGDSGDSHARAFALVATHAARLRDLEKPSDWREAMRNLGGLSSNAEDALHQAYDAGLDLADLKNIQLRGQPASNLPTLLFSGEEGQFWVRPNEVWRGHIVDRKGDLIMPAGEGSQ